MEEERNEIADALVHATSSVQSQLYWVQGRIAALWGKTLTLLTGAREERHRSVHNYSNRVFILNNYFLVGCKGVECMCGCVCKRGKAKGTRRYSARATINMFISYGKMVWKIASAEMVACLP